MVVQDSDYRWSLKTNQIGTNQRLPTQPQKPQNQSSIPTKQNSSYRFTKTEIQQDIPIKPRSSSPTTPQPIPQSNPYEVVKRELAQVSSEEKVKILENAFRQDRFAELEDEQINALQSILEEAKREVNITNTAYNQGRLSIWKNNYIAIAVISIALAMSGFFIINQLKSNSTNQPTPTIPQNR
ncbi:hypothetical protein NIES4103_49290 [Nostoc sp. NIES-4103]|nr:hypothetical protein NIES4103_49290 [Nostoc sp. NIES-4103]